MKKIILILLIVLNISNVSSQETALDKVSLEVCEYFKANEEKLKKMNHDDKVAQFGIKMIESYLLHKDALEKEGVTFNLSTEGEKLGEMIGLNMMKFCPQSLMALAEEDVVNESPEEAKEQSIEGKIKKISGEDLYVLEVKDINGKTQKFVWITNFSGSDKLLELEGKVKGKEVKVYYKNIELFSPKLQEYTIRKKITRLEF